MASPAHSSHPGQRASYAPQYRRSSFNGAKQLRAAQAPNRRILVVVGVLAAALLAAVATIAIHVAGS